MKCLARRIAAWTLTALLLCAFSLPAAAVTTSTDDSQTQSGVTGSVGPFMLMSCSIAQGQTDVATNVLIQLDFERNVINISVLQNNLGCFHLVDADGNSVAIQLLFPDDQLQRTVKRTIFVQPVEPLAELSNYVLAVDNNLLAKNGTYIDQAYNVEFTTGTEQAVQENAVLESLGDYVIVYESNTPMNERSVKGSTAKENAAYYTPYDSYAQSLPEPEIVARIMALSVLFLGGCVTAALLWARRRQV